MPESYKIKILSHVLEDDDAIILILEEQLKMNEVDYKIFSKDSEFIEAFHDKVHIAIIDFKPSNATAMDGVQITKIIMDKNPDCKIIMITGMHDEANKCVNIIEFFHSGGFRWLGKDEDKFAMRFTEYVQQSIHFAKNEIQRKEAIEKTAGHVVRDRKIESVENNT